MLEVGTVGVALHLPLSMFILLQLALLEEFGKQVFGLESVLRLGLLELKSLLELLVSALKFFCPFFLSQLLFF